MSRLHKVYVTKLSNEDKILIAKELKENGVDIFKYINSDLSLTEMLNFESNTNYGLTEPTDNNYYVIVILDSERLEQTINGEKMSELLKYGMEKKYECTRENVEINPNTGRVCQITFTELN